MQVEIWSDVVCPWCYLGKRRFERALAQFEGAEDVEVTWRSFQLNPAQPKGDPRNHDEYLAGKMGASIGQIREMNDRLVALAADEGLDYHFETYKVINTFDAHRVMHLARTLGKGTQAHERMLRAQLVEGDLLEDDATLARLMAELGIPEAETLDVLASGRFAAEVQEEIRDAASLGCTGVPFFVFDRTYGVSGAQASDVFLNVLRRVRELEAAPADA